MGFTPCPAVARTGLPTGVMCSKIWPTRVGTGLARMALMQRLALLALAGFVTTSSAGCILVVEADGPADLTVANRSVADRLEIALEPIDDGDALSDGATIDGGEQATLEADVGLYELSLIDTAGEGCVVRRFAFVVGDHVIADIFDNDLVECASQLPPGLDFPEQPWD